MTQHQRTWIYRILTLVMIFLWSAPVAAEETWALFQVSVRSIEPDVGETFRDLLQSEITARTGAHFVRIEEECKDEPCALTGGAKVGADVAVIASLSALGQKVFVTVQAFDVGKSEPKSAQRMTIDKIDELDVVAARVAKAFAEHENVGDTSELGMITEKEARPEIRREGYSGFELSLGGLFPVSAYADEPAGLSVDFGFWYEATKFAIMPRIGLRFKADPYDDANSFIDIPIDVGGFWILGKGDVAPFIGGGAGIHYLSETRRVIKRTGTIIQTENQAVLEDEGWGFGTYGRVGVLLLRTYSVRIALSADYNITFLELNHDGFAQSLTGQISVLF